MENPMLFPVFAQGIDVVNLFLATLLLLAVPFMAWYIKGCFAEPKNPIKAASFEKRVVELEIEATARPEGGKATLTVAGLAQAYETPSGVLIRLPALGPEKTILVDHDGCSGLKVWHAQGEVNLTEDELTELVLSALPEGGRNIVLGKLHAKAYSTRIGVVAAIWKPVLRPGR